MMDNSKEPIEKESESTFSPKPVELGTSALGDRLRRARQAMGMSISEFAGKLTIPPEHLAALEESRFDDLPALVYARGYLMRIAKALDLPAHFLLEEFHREISWRRPDVAQAQTKKPFREPPTFSLSIFSPVVLRWVGIVGIVVIVLGYLLFSVGGILRPPTLVLSEPTRDQEVTTDTVVVAGKTDPDARLTLNGQAINNRDGTFSEQVGLQNGLNIIEVRAANRLGRTQIIQRRIQATLPASRPGETVGVQVILRVIGKTSYVKIVSDGRPFFEGTLLPGTEKLLEASETIALSVSDTNDVAVTYLGKKWSPLDSRGFPITSLVFSRDGSTNDIDVALADREL